MVDVCQSVKDPEDTKQCRDQPHMHDFVSLLSDPRYDILAFKDVADLSREEKLAVAECMDKVLLAFLEEIGFQLYSPQRDHKLRKDLWAWGRCTLVAVCDGGWSQAEHILEGSASIVEHFFPLARRDSRLHLAFAVAVALHVELSATKASYAESLAYFTFNLLLQKNNQEEWQTMYAGVIKGFVEHFGANDPRIGTLGAVSLAQFIETASTEHSFSKRLPPHLSSVHPEGEKLNRGSSDGFAYFFRILSGVPGPFISGLVKPSKHEEVSYDYWITSVVNLTTFMNLANDLLSWPKEVRSGETQNYMSLQTRARQQAGTPSQFQLEGKWTFRDTLCETIKTLIYVANRTYTEAERSAWNADLASRTWVGFKHGFISWHLRQPRYGLNHLLGGICSGSEKGVF
ncbi:hypothetical protein F5X99DRAFT_420877 [Biscogniauxia marginata]|nr:hypothetical protein F5X99DRAFT_420877 [Biscogniauxia marginata]